MAADTRGATAREAVAVFEDAETFYAAVDELLSSGFDLANLSMMAGQEAIEETLGHRIERVEEAEDDVTVPRRAYIAPESLGDAQGWLVGGLVYVGAVAAAGAIFASGGTVAGAIVAAGLAGGSGGLIGAALAQFVGDHHAEYLHEQLERGGLLLWVLINNEGQEGRAVDILTRHSAHDVHVHDIAAG